MFTANSLFFKATNVKLFIDTICISKFLCFTYKYSFTLLNKDYGNKKEKKSYTYFIFLMGPLALGTTL
jgi:hypothetical protein